MLNFIAEKAVGANGTVVIARAQPYHIEILADGAFTAGPPVDFTGTRPTDEDKLAWLERSQRDALRITPVADGGATRVEMHLPGPEGLESQISQ